MMMHKTFDMSLKIVLTTLFLSGCSTLLFPDFADDDTQVVIDEGGNVNVRKINSNGIVVADKENAVYEDELADNNVFVQNENVVETVTPAKTVKVDAEKIYSETSETFHDSVDADVKEAVATVDESIDDVDVAKNDESRRDTLPVMHYLAETIYFDNGSSVVDYKFYGVLKNVAKVVKDNNAIVTINGYASSRTRNTDPATHKLINFKVSAERAENVAKLLRKYGVDAGRVFTQALSDSSPLYQEVMPEGERLNRRVEIYLTY